MTSHSEPAVSRGLPAPAGAALDALAAAISSLKAGALAGTGPAPLRGRNIGVLCEDPQRPEVFMLERTASALGARVALVQPGLDGIEARRIGERAGKVLGKLYDALICVDVAPWLVQVLRDASGIPASADLADRWAALRHERPDVQDEDRHLLKALVLQACA